MVKRLDWWVYSSIVVGITLACANKAPPSPSPGGGMATLNIAIGSVPMEKKSRVNGYEIMLTPLDFKGGTCFKRREVYPYKNDIGDIKLLRDCEFLVAISLGQLSADGNTLDKVAFAPPSAAGQRLTKSSYQGQRARMEFVLTDTDNPSEMIRPDRKAKVKGEPSSAPGVESSVDPSGTPSDAGEDFSLTLELQIQEALE